MKIKKRKSKERNRQPDTLVIDNPEDEDLDPELVRQAYKDLPNGRPKFDEKPRRSWVSLTTTLRAVLNEDVPEQFTDLQGQRINRTRGEVLMRIAIVHAMNGNARYFKEIMDRVEGPITMEMFGVDPREKARQAMLAMKQMDEDHGQA